MHRAEDAGAGPDYALLDAYHGRGAPTWSLRPWLFLLFGGLLAWVGAGVAIMTVIGAVTGEVGGALAILGICLLITFLGIRLFRKGIA